MVILGILGQSDIDRLELNVVRLCGDDAMTAILPHLIVLSR